MSTPNLPAAPFKSIYASVTVAVTDTGVLYKCPNNIDVAGSSYDAGTSRFTLALRQPIAPGLAVAAVLPWDTGDAAVPPTKYSAPAVRYDLDSDNNISKIHVFWFTTDTAGDTEAAAPFAWHLALFDVGNVRPFPTS